MLKDKLQKILAKKRNLPEAEKKAKMDVVKGLSDDMADSMHERMGKLKKVAVESDSKEGLKKGLDKAKELVSRKRMSEGGEVDQSYTEAGHDLMDEPEEEGEKYMDANPHQDQGSNPDVEASDEMDEFEGLDMSEVNDKLQKLMQLKKKMESEQQ